MDATTSTVTTSDSLRYKRDDLRVDAHSESGSFERPETGKAAPTHARTVTRRPAFLQASDKFLATVLRPAIGQAIRWLNKNPEAGCAQVRLPSDWRTTKFRVEIIRADGSASTNEYSGATLMYGPQFPDATDFTQRDTAAWEKKQGVQPFRQLQEELATQKGLFLVDTSDPEKGSGTFIYIYRKLGDNPPERLWHGLNLIPKAYRFKESGFSAVDSKRAQETVAMPSPIVSQPVPAPAEMLAAMQLAMQILAVQRQMTAMVPVARS